MAATVLGGEFRPESDIPIWRYLDIPKLVGLLSGHVYFAPLLTFEDRLDGVAPAQLRDLIRKSLEGITTSEAVESSIRQQAQRMVQDHPELSTESASAVARKAHEQVKEKFLAIDPGEYFRSANAASCWHQRPGESLFMWDAYAGRGAGVAVKTTVAALQAALQHYPMRIEIGRVRYGLDFSSRIPELMAISPRFPTLLKEEPFEHESEVRAITPSEFNGDTWSGQNVPAPLDEFPFEVIVSPLVQPFVGDAVRRIVRQFSDRVEVRPSDLARHFATSWRG